MSRAMNVKLTETQVAAQCLAAGVSVSVLEVLPSGGTHLVCTTSEGADEIRIKFKNHLIAGKVKRFPFFVPRTR